MKYLRAKQKSLKNETQTQPYWDDNLSGNELSTVFLSTGLLVQMGFAIGVKNLQTHITYFLLNTHELETMRDKRHRGHAIYSGIRATDRL
ncbi:MAG: hypothetical protein CL688_02430 [Candidatus Puniceispirillum sp.]|nr:hypothetical protein [Candidatus Puniceispirillum sp.]|tara:strand:+ start:537 stop:806 length:270 start_codon:yes stop_codon:yes gene_type:complete